MAGPLHGSILAIDGLSEARVTVNYNHMSGEDKRN